MRFARLDNIFKPSTIAENVIAAWILPLGTCEPNHSATSVIPMTNKNPGASITTLGLWSIKRDSGPAANIITVTAAITAMNMIGICSVMPKAVTILSMENTRLAPGFA